MIYFFLFLVGFESSELFLFAEAVEAGAEVEGGALAGPQKRGYNLACPEEEVEVGGLEEELDGPEEEVKGPEEGGCLAGPEEVLASTVEGGCLPGPEKVYGPMDGGCLAVPVEVVFGGSRPVGPDEVDGGCLAVPVEVVFGGVGRRVEVV